MNTRSSYLNISLMKIKKNSGRKSLEMMCCEKIFGRRYYSETKAELLHLRYYTTFNAFNTLLILITMFFLWSFWQFCRCQDSVHRSLLWNQRTSWFEPDLGILDLKVHVNASKDSKCERIFQIYQSQLLRENGVLVIMLYILAKNIWHYN